MKLEVGPVPVEKTPWCVVVCVVHVCESEVWPIIKYLDPQHVNRGCLFALRRPSNSVDKETLGF